MIDAHCHIDLYPHPERVLAEINTEGLTVITVTNLPSHYEVGIEHVRSLKRVRMAVGLHPLLAKQHTQHELSLFARIVEDSSYVGEVGLDGSVQGRMSLSLQRRGFRFALSQLQDRQRFVSLHSRGAEEEVADTLAEFGVRRAVFHWFTGRTSLATQLADEGHYFSVNPAMLRSRSGQALLQSLPPQAVLTESDGPHVQVKGRPVHPRDVHDVLKHLGVVWGIDEAGAASRVDQNLRRLLRAVSTPP